MNSIFKKKIKALGFVEILIAIVVVGVISTVFLSITTNAMKDLLQTERTEYMARMAKDGMNIAQEIANQDKADIFIEDADRAFPMEEGYCYIPIRIDSGDSVTYEFVKEDNGESFENVQDPEADISLDFATIRSELLAKFETGGTTFEDEYFWDDNYFMVMCIESIDTTSTRWANVRFWVGDRHVAGEITNDSDIKDFN
ncbi:MAG: hypothetical protein PHP08_03610, partial [Candidatus Dojkabacteria bacterium]|nr:hypothetical protein [Candidatus Dojkabacteria bacterium]